MASSHATQAAAADKDFVYAVSSTGIAKHSRASGERLAVSTGSAVHLNSVLLMDGKLYAAHSNFPLKPEQGNTLRWVDTLASPFPGQGIAIDLKTEGLVGIDRSRKMVVFAKLQEVPEK